MFLLVVWMVVYAPLIARTFHVMPIFAVAAWMTGIMRLSRARVSAIISTFLHAEAVHLPLPPEYFDSFIAAAALSTSPASLGVAYGSYSESPLLYITGGAMCVAMEPTTGPPQALRRALLSMIRFIVRYQVRSPTFDSRRGFRVGSVTYCRIVFGCGLDCSSSSLPAATCA